MHPQDVSSRLTVASGEYLNTERDAALPMA
jgi:hypothetical protein